MVKKIKVGIFIFNEVEVLDFAGPFEVFSLAEKNNEKAFEVITIGETRKVISARNDLKVIPSNNFSDNINLDILIIPGGYGAEEVEIKNKVTLNWILDQSRKVAVLASVCSGAFLLAACGILDGKNATTHWMNVQRLEKEYPKVNVLKNVKFVDEGDVLTSGGISAGIDMSFHIVKRILGINVAEFTAKKMEYDIEI